MELTSMECFKSFINTKDTNSKCLSQDQHPQLDNNKEPITQCV